MKVMKKMYLTMALVLAVVSVKAQEVSPVDFMRLNPYQMRSNPATELPYLSVMSMFVGNTNFSFYNTGLRYDNCFDFDVQGKPTTLNLKKLAAGLKENNYLGINLDANLFSLYKLKKHGMVTFDYSIHLQSDILYNDGLFKLLACGNSEFVGDDNPANVCMNLNAKAFHQIAVGYQMNINDKLSIGTRAKLLFGIADISTDAFDVKLFTDPNTYALRLEENIAMRTSLPGMFGMSDGKLLSNGGFSFSDLFHNPGMGIDLGAEYHITKKIGVVAAVHDLGFIHWNANNYSLNSTINDVGDLYDNGAIQFDGLDFDELQMIASDDAYRELFIDTMMQYFGLGFEGCQAYNTMLNTNILLRGYYDLTSQSRFSAQFQSCFRESGIRPAMTFAYNGSFNHRFDVCVTYTMMKNSFDNIGLGVAGNFGTLHIYLTTSNLFGFFNPLNTSLFNAQAGIVFNMR